MTRDTPTTAASVTALMAVATDLWNGACREHEEGESPDLVRARLTLHAHAVHLILERTHDDRR